MSGGMQKVAAVAQSSFKAVDSAVARTRTGIAGTGRELQNTARQARSAARDFDALSNSMDKAGKRRSFFASVPGGGTSVASLIAGIGLTAGISSIINTGLQGQAQKTSFEVMAGASEGNKLYSDLTKYAQDSIYGNEVYKMAQTQLAFGASAKQVMPTLKMLGDIAMGDAQRFQQLNLAFSQIRATGRLMGQDLLQLVNAGFNPLQVISEKTGRSMAQLKEDVEKGRVDFNMVENAFLSATQAGGKFYNMTEKIAATDFGKLLELKGQLEGVALQLGGVLAQAVGNFITNYGVPFVNWLSNAVKWAQENWNWLRHVAGGVLSVVAALKAWSIAQGILNAVLAANPVMKLVGAIGALAYAVWQLYGKVQIVTDAVDAMGSVFNGIIGIIETCVVTIKRFFSGDATTNSFAKAGYDHGKAYTDGMMQAAEEFNFFDFLRKAMGTHQRTHDYSSFNRYADKRYQELVDSENSRLAPAQSTFTNSAFGRLWAKWANPTKPLVSGVAAVGGNATSIKGQSTTKSEAISGGGARPINVTVHKFFDDINITAQTMSEGLEDFERRVQEVLLRTLQSLKGS